jgi:NAD-dependent deacetylase
MKPDHVLIENDAAEGGRQLARMLALSRRCVVLTGAGISTESGVPDFRTAGSPWLVNKPIPFREFVAHHEVRREAWRRKFVMDDHFAGAQPARGHRVVRQLAARGPVDLVITQNIDGLHQASGLPAEKLVEIHGNGTYAACLDCQERHELDRVRAHFEQHGDAPGCRACGGIVKSATIAFGQPMPRAPMSRALNATQSCDLFLVLGSSLVVRPAADLPALARDAGADLVIVTRGETPLDGLAHAVIRADLGDTLSTCAQEMGLDPLR